MAAVIPLAGRSTFDSLRKAKFDTGVPQVTLSSSGLLSKIDERSPRQAPQETTYSTTTPRRTEPRTKRIEFHVPPKSKEGWDGKSHVKPLPPSRPERLGGESTDEMKALVRRCLKRGERAFVDEAVGDTQEPTWPAPRRRRGPERLFASYDAGAKGTISRRDCREILRSIGVALSDKDLTKVVDACSSEETGRVDYGALLAPEDRPEARKAMKKRSSSEEVTMATPQAGSYAAQYAAEKQRAKDRAGQVEGRLCATMTNPANLATLRKRLERADGSRSGTLAPTDFARAIREYAGEPLDEDDEMALCDAYDHRGLRLLDNHGGLQAPALLPTARSTSETAPVEDGEVAAPLASPRRSRLARDDDEGSRAFVERKLFGKRKGQGSTWMRLSKSDEGVRAAMWRAPDSEIDEAIVRGPLAEKATASAQERQRPVGFRPVLGRAHFEPNFDAVDYEKFLASLQERCDADPKNSLSQRRAVRKLSAALATDELKEQWDRAFTDVQEPKNAVATLKQLGVHLTSTEASAALAMAVKNGDFDAAALKATTLQVAERMDDADDAEKQRLYDAARARGEARRKGGGIGVARPQTAQLLRTQQQKAPAAATTTTSERRPIYDDRPILLRSRFSDDDFIVRRARTYDDAIVPRAAGRPTRRPSGPKKRSLSVDAGRFCLADYMGGGPKSEPMSRHDRKEKLTLARAMASVAARANLPLTSGAVDGKELKAALRRVGAPVGARDADRIVKAAGNGSTATPAEIHALLRKYGASPPPKRQEVKPKVVEAINFVAVDKNADDVVRSFPCRCCDFPFRSGRQSKTGSWGPVRPLHRPSTLGRRTDPSPAAVRPFCFLAMTSSQVERPGGRIPSRGRGRRTTLKRNRSRSFHRIRPVTSSSPRKPLAVQRSSATDPPRSRPTPSSLKIHPDELPNPAPSGPSSLIKLNKTP